MSFGGAMTGSTPATPRSVLKWYGVRDAAEGQTAIDSAEADGGGVVYFPPGEYETDGYVIDSDNVLVMGSGPTTIVSPAGSADDLFTFRNCDYFGIRDMRIDGAWNGSRGLVLEGARWGTVLNIVGDRFSAPMLDMRADGAATQNCNNNLIQHFHAENCTRFIRMQGEVATRYVTLNSLVGVSAVGAGSAVSTLIDFAKACDTNTFAGITRLSLNYAGSIGVIYNSASPTTTQDVYGNHFEGDLAIDQDAEGTVSVRVNDCTTAGSGPWTSRIHHLRLGGSHPTPIDINDENALVSIPISLGSYSDSSRPSAANQIPGTPIWNTDDGAPNWSNGSEWVDATGTTT